MKVYRDSLLKCNNPGGHYYWEGGQPNLYIYDIIYIYIYICKYYISWKGMSRDGLSCSSWCNPAIDVNPVKSDNKLFCKSCQSVVYRQHLVSVVKETVQTRLFSCIWEYFKKKLYIYINN